MSAEDERTVADWWPGTRDPDDPDHDGQCESEFIHGPMAYSPCGCVGRRRAALSDQLAERGLWIVEPRPAIDLGAADPVPLETNQYTALFAAGDLQIYKGPGVPDEQEQPMIDLPENVSRPSAGTQLRVTVVVNWRRGAVYGVTTDSDEARRWALGLIVQEGDATAVTSTVALVSGTLPTGKGGET